MIFFNHAVETAVEAVNTEKDTAIRYLALDGGDPSVAFGCQWHPSVPAHDHMAELILDGATATVDIAPFDANRLPPLDTADLVREG